MDTAAKSTLPPGPPGRWRPTFQLIRDPRGSMSRWAGQYGDPFLIHALNGPVAVTGRPDLVKEVFSKNSSAFEVFAIDTVKPILGSGSMLLLNGEEHRRERKLVMPMFHGSRMRAYAEMMERCTLGAMENIGERQAISMMDTTTEISLGIIARAIFGDQDQKFAKDLVRCSRELVERSSPFLFFSQKMQFRLLGLSLMDRFESAATSLRCAVDAELARRESDPRDREDILDLLIHSTYEDGSKIERQHLHDELGTFLFAGHETSAIALAWAMYHLHNSSDSLAKLRLELREAEGASPEEVASLPYLKAVVQETLRLNPVVTEVLRILKEPMEFGEYALPAGTAVAPAAVLAHYREETFPDPNAFRPERFIENSFSSAQYMPFGGGHRRCAGAAFATYEMAIVLGTLLQHYEFELLEKKPVIPRRRNVTMGPSTGVAMNCRRIRSLG